jgi:hypothetical protein
MPKPGHAILIAVIVMLAAARPAQAQTATVEFRDEVTLLVTSTDSSHRTRFALVGAGKSFSRMDATTILGDTIFLYTPAKFTITQATSRARIVALSNEADLRLAAVERWRTTSDMYVDGREFEVLWQASALARATGERSPLRGSPIQP